MNQIHVATSNQGTHRAVVTQKRPNLFTVELYRLVTRGSVSWEIVEEPNTYYETHDPVRAISVAQAFVSPTLGRPSLPPCPREMIEVMLSHIRNILPSTECAVSEHGEEIKLSDIDEYLELHYE